MRQEQVRLCFLIFARTHLISTKKGKESICACCKYSTKQTRASSGPNESMMERPDAFSFRGRPFKNGCWIYRFLLLHGNCMPNTVKSQYPFLSSRLDEMLFNDRQRALQGSSCLFLPDACDQPDNISSAK